MAARPVLISLDQARTILLGGIQPIASERLMLSECGGRTLADDLVADRDQPPGPVSAMDGYAVSDADAVGGAELEIIGESPAGHPYAGSVSRGQAVRVATGGTVPDGADRVVMQEIVEGQGDRIRLRETPGTATYVRPRALDFAIGQTIARGGEELTPARLALAAAANRGALDVRKRPRVLLLASGDELREPGSDLEAGAIVNSAAYALDELIKIWGGLAVRAPILADDPSRCRAQLDAANLQDFDIAVPLGGASVGDRDVLKPTIAALGANVLFDRIAVQPGKPTWHARFTDGPMVLGLPGNPVSAFVCAHLLLKPLIMAFLGRCPVDALVPARLTAPMPQGSRREVYWRAKLGVDEQGGLWVSPDTRLDSSLQLPLTEANALVRRLPDASASAAGDLIDVVRIAPL